MRVFLPAQSAHGHGCQILYALLLLSGLLLLRTLLKLSLPRAAVHRRLPRHRQLYMRVYQVLGERVRVRVRVRARAEG